MSVGTLEKHTPEQAAHQYEATHEQWNQAELSRDPSLTALRILYNDIQLYGEVRPETWDYFDMQEMSGGAESMSTRHITKTEGYYDPVDDVIVATTAGGERVTYDSFTLNGLHRSQERLAEDPDFAFQVTRDLVYYDNFHGPVKDMWRREVAYDTVISVSTFPEDTIDELGAKGRALVRKLAYDDNGFKGFINIFHKRKEDGVMEFAAVRLGQALPAHFARYLEKQGHDPLTIAALESHSYGRLVLTTTAGDRTLDDVAAEQAAIFDTSASEITGKRHYFGDTQEGIDAYELFGQCPELWQAYRGYHRLLAGHLAGWPLSDDLYDYLVAIHDSVAYHVLEPHESAKLGAQLTNGSITADTALACKKIMNYAHYATLNNLLAIYNKTGVITDITGNDKMQAYGSAANGSGGDAAARGDSFGDCDTVYGDATAADAAALAERAGISLEEALRRLANPLQTERWSRGQCRNCERETQIWAKHDGGCDVCHTCAMAHTFYKQRGLDRERTKALAEKDQQMAALRAYDAEMESYAGQEEASDEIQVGATRQINGRTYVLMNWQQIGSATTMWVDAATGQLADEQ